LQLIIIFYYRTPKGTPLASGIKKVPMTPTATNAKLAFVPSVTSSPSAFDVCQIAAAVTTPKQQQEPVVVGDENSTPKNDQLRTSLFPVTADASVEVAVEQH